MAEVSDATYTPILVNRLRGDIKIPFDTYVRVAGQYILYCRAGDSFEGVRLERLKSKKSIDVRAEVIQGFQQAAAQTSWTPPRPVWLRPFAQLHAALC